MVTLASFNFQDVQVIGDVNAIHNDMHQFIVHELTYLLLSQKSVLYLYNYFLRVTHYRELFEKQQLEKKQQQDDDLSEAAQLLDVIKDIVASNIVSGANDLDSKLSGHSILSLLSNANEINVGVITNLPLLSLARNI